MLVFSKNSLAETVQTAAATQLNTVVEVSIDGPYEAEQVTQPLKCSRFIVIVTVVR